MPERTRGRPRAADKEPRAYIRWINERAYAELGAWSEWGGRRQEPLVANGEKLTTRDPNTAVILLGARLTELCQQRALRPSGAPAFAPDIPTSIGAFIGYHLAAKADVKGRRRPSDAELSLQRSRLMHAARFLRGHGVRDLREIHPRHIELYLQHLQEVRPNGASAGGGRTGTLSPATQRKYLGALGHMLQRAKSKGVLTTNLVHDLVDKPTPDSSPTRHLELWEVGNPGAAALATRVVATEVRAPERRAALRQALGTPFVQFAEAPLGGIAIAPAEGSPR